MIELDQLNDPTDYNFMLALYFVLPNRMNTKAVRNVPRRMRYYFGVRRKQKGKSWPKTHVSNTAYMQDF